MHLALLLVAAATVGAGEQADPMLDCIKREAPRIERLDQSLESVGRIVVNVACAEALRRVADQIIGPQRVAIPDSLVRGYEFRAVQAAIEAREQRLSGR